MNNSSLSASEAFIRDFHDSRPGGTSSALGSLHFQYDDHEWLSTYQLLIRSVPEIPWGRVLDLACGDGHLLSMLRQHLPESWGLYGLDFSSGELRRALEVSDNSTHYVQGMAQGLPYADESFDTVLCHMAFMLMENQPEVVKEIARVLKPGGTFSAIVGGAPSATAIQQFFVNCIRELPQNPDYAEVQFSRSNHDPDRLQTPIKAELNEVSAKNLTIPLNLTPEEAWQWFSGMYDLSTRQVEDLNQVRAHFISQLEHKVYNHILTFHFFHAVKNGS